MLNYLEIQNAYEDLYLHLSRYFWKYDVILALADLESEAFKVMPSLESLTKKLSYLRSQVNNYQIEDEEVSESFDKFFDLIKDQNSTYAKLVFPGRLTSIENI